MTDYLSMLPAEFSNHEHSQHIPGVNIPPRGDFERRNPSFSLATTVIVGQHIFWE